VLLKRDAQPRSLRQRAIAETNGLSRAASLLEEAFGSSEKGN
jgi:hypothetical protein